MPCGFLSFATPRGTKLEGKHAIKFLRICTILVGLVPAGALAQNTAPPTGVPITRPTIGQTQYPPTGPGVSQGNPTKSKDIGTPSNSSTSQKCTVTSSYECCLRAGFSVGDCKFIHGK